MKLLSTLAFVGAASAIDAALYLGKDCVQPGGGEWALNANVEPMCMNIGTHLVESAQLRAIPTDWNIMMEAFTEEHCNSADMIWAKTSNRANHVCLTSYVEQGNGRTTIAGIKSIKYYFVPPGTTWKPPFKRSITGNPAEVVRGEHSTPTGFKKIGMSHPISSA